MTGTEDNRYAEFDGLIARHRKLIERLCMWWASGESNLSADYLQECYMSLWEHRDTLRPGSTERQEASWVVLHCRSAVEHYRRRVSVISFLPIDEGLIETLSDPASAPYADDEGYLDSLAQGLTRRERQAFRLMAKGYSNRELAEEMGIKSHSARQLRHLIIKKIRNNHIKQK